MKVDPLEIHSQPLLTDGRLVLAFSGWMDGGDVSTGTVDWLAKALDTSPIARIDPEDFYIYSFPGSMEVTSLFRPATRIEDGIITEYQPPENRFLCAEDCDLVLFHGKEPNLHWGRFADCIFSLAKRVGVSTIYFVGSFGGTVPHTREPRLLSTVSDDVLKPTLAPYGVSFTNYEGPASFSTHLLAQARRRGFLMASLVAEIPAYIQGANPKCIEAVLKKLAALLGLQVDLTDLRNLAGEWEEKLDHHLESESELAAHIHKLEENYDNEVFDTQMTDLKEWLEEKGIRVD